MPHLEKPLNVTKKRMNDDKKLVVEKLKKSHICGSFNCGKSGLNDYLKKYARQNDKLGIGRTFIATFDNSNYVAAYYTLASASIESKSLTEILSRKLPKYPVPCALLARLAVDINYQGKRFGEYMLMDALKRVLTVSNQIGIFSVIVHAVDESAARFYMKYGFDVFDDENKYLVISLKAINESLK